MTTLDEPTTPEEAPALVPAEAENSMSPDSTPAPEKKPARKKAAPPAKPYAVVGLGETDTVLYSRAVKAENAKTRKSLTIHHLQRRLKELGYPEAYADLDGTWRELTTRSVIAWQTDAGHEPTGDLTPEQFSEIFDGDINVTVVLDIP